MYYLDSCICIDLMRGHLPHGLQLMRENDPGLFKIPSIVVSELVFGVENSKRIQENRLILERFLQPFEIVPFDEASSRACGAVRAQLAQNGRRIGPNDLLIASMALAHQAVLVSNNTKDFKAVPNLSFESWYELDLPLS